ncbi:Metallo-dependent hydrolase [Marasmius fiardii PR-910]|nr:Metallo-dependent hydrolase [Marasmius fiardii PR-910]
MTTSLLLKDGVVLVHDSDDHVVPTRTDILIEGNVIARIEPGIEVSASVEVVDCSNKIVSPGFVDGHQHVWQTFNKGRHGDETLLDYMPTGNFTSSLHSREDIFWGQLGGCLTLLNAGTTTVVDHAHIHYFPEASETAISATVSSGIRSVFCFTPTPRAASFNPLVLNRDLLEPWVISSFSSLAAKAPFGPNGRVQLGVAYDGWFVPQEVATPFFDLAVKAGVKVLTTHVVGSISGLSTVVPTLEKWELIDKFHVLLSHATEIPKEDIQKLVKHGGYVVSTPSTELQMAHGRPICFGDEVYGNACLGGDCHSNGGIGIPGEMKLGLQAERGMRNQKIIDKGLMIKTVYPSLENAFNLGTIHGARAVGMGKSIGSIEVGKFADLVVFDGDSPSMVCAAQNDPVAAIVLFSTPADVSVVIVDGQVRKLDGKLKATDVEGQERLEWNEIGKRLLMRGEVYREKIGKVDFEEAKRALIKAWHIDESKMTNEV